MALIGGGPRWFCGSWYAIRVSEGSALLMVRPLANSRRVLAENSASGGARDEPPPKIRTAGLSKNPDAPREFTARIGSRAFSALLLTGKGYSFGVDGRGREVVGDEGGVGNWGLG